MTRTPLASALLPTARRSFWRHFNAYLWRERTPAAYARLHDWQIEQLVALARQMATLANATLDGGR